MIRTQNPFARIKLIQRTVSKLPCRIALPLVGVYLENSFKSDSAQTYDHFGFQDLNLPFKIWLTIIQFFWTWLISRRRATTRRRDIHILQDEAIAAGLSKA